MTNKLKVACIGCSDLALRGVLPHLLEADAREKIDLVSVCDIDTERAALTAKKFKADAWHGEYDQLLETVDVDLVLILTPIGCHVDQAIAALECGKHVYLQKPMATDLAGADRVIAAAEASAGKLLVAPVNHLCPMTGKLQEIIAGGELGTIYSVYTATHFTADYDGSGFDRSWHYSADGGPLRDRTVYSLATLIDLFGPVRQLAALSNLRNPLIKADAAQVAAAIDDNTLILLQFDDGIQAVASGTYSMEGRQVPAGFLGIYGSHGTIETTVLDPLTWYPTEAMVRIRDAAGQTNERSITCPLTDVPGLHPPHNTLQECHVYADIIHLVDSVLANREPAGTAAQARHITEIIDKAYLAAQTGHAQRLATEF